MKRTKLILATLVLFGFSACKKADQASQITLTPSATSTSIGQPISVTLSANANVSNWTVTPSSIATQTYGLTTSTVNNFSFSQAGVYTISVRARKISNDSTTQSLSAAWNTGGGTRGTCTPGVDTAAVAVTVTGK